MTNVTIYTKFLCGFCDRAKRLLTSKGVAFTEHDVTFDKRLRAEMAERSGGITTVPQVFVNNTHVGGSDELAALDESGRLDALLADVK
ncbi:MAG: glutaredoxin 3 [Hyphomicrobiales bacterium]|nr:glutaredoxin 3 [Hyphomicrobiales bacterium]